MHTPETLARQRAFAAKVAWLHEPVQLSCPLVPWFLLCILAQSLHGVLCSLEQCLLVLFEAMLLGQLPEQQEAAGSAEPEARRAPSLGAQRRSGRAACARSSSAAMADAAWSEDGDTAGVVAPAAHRTAEWWHAVEAGPAGVLPAGLGARGLWPDRCTTSTVFAAAWMRRDNCV